MTDQVVTGSGRSHLSEIFDLAVETGRRINAICQLRYSDLRLDDGAFGSIHWPADTDKMERESLAPLSQIARGAIDRVLRERPGIGDAYLFPSPKDSKKPMSRHLAAKWLRRAEKLAGEEPRSKARSGTPTAGRGRLRGSTCRTWTWPPREAGSVPRR